MSDFCYGRPMLNRIFRQAELMDRVMERLGIDPRRLRVSTEAWLGTSPHPVHRLL